MSTVVKDLGAATAYGYAVEKGYTGTEAEFAELMASYAEVGQTAVNAAQTATTKASEAATSATTAITKASEATTAATTATTKAGEASTSASTATSAKDTAVSASQTATTKATEATTAAATATSAKTDAVAANTAAQSAKTAAQTAQTGAETAAASVQSSAAQIATNAEDISQLKSDLTQKANQDGYYADLVSGGATQILSDMVETDTTPYNYRTAGGPLEIGDRMKLKRVVGGSLAVNQLVRNGNFAEVYDWQFNNAGYGSYTVQNNVATIVAGQDAVGNTSTYFRTMIFANIVDHVYLALMDVNPSVSTTVRYQYPAAASGTRSKVLTADTWQTYGSIVKGIAQTNDATFYINVGASLSAGDTILVKNAMVFDLTQMFGATIADYVYSLETATAGAGVAWLKAHFPKIFDSGYIPYNAGTFEHVSGLSAHKMTGFNQWDEEWEVGAFDANGQKISGISAIRSKNYIPVLPNTTYYYKTGSNTSVSPFEYDANKTFLKRSGYILNQTFTTGGNTHYLMIGFPTAYGTTYKNDICINLHWDGERDGEYEPYEDHSYPLDSDVTLRGIPKLDANNNLYYDGDEYASDGTVTRRYGIVDLGTLTWAAPSAYGNVYRSDTNLPDAVNGSQSMGKQAPIILSTSAFKNSYNVTDAAQVATAGLIGINYNKVYVTFAESMTAAQIKTALSGVYMLYTLKNEYITTEEADPYTEIQNVSNWGTEEFVTTSLVPVGHETAYQPDLRAKIEVAPESPDTDGLYLVKRKNGQNSYVAYLGELPTDPTTDGTYTLKATVSSGTVTKTWEADT